MTQKCVALLGRKDEPTDAVEEYCHYLGDALRLHGFDTEIVRVRWVEKGWTVALRELRQQAIEWRGAWVLIQYTALAWSARGFPLRFLRVLKVLRSVGTRIGVVYHDVEPYAGKRTVDKLRGHAQLRTMREALRLADLAVFTVALRKISWIRRPAPNAVFIPVGANLPAPENAWVRKQPDKPRTSTVAIYGITGGHAGIAEIEHIAAALEYVAQRAGKVRLLVFGRNSESARLGLRAKLQDAVMELEILGLLPADKVVEALRSSDVLLFVRGVISSRRGSAIAGIACGLPVVAMEGPETAPPITEAGVVLLSAGTSYQKTGEVLVRILTDGNYGNSLAERSRRAQQQYFSWQAIGARYAEALRGQSNSYASK
jgi:glycosyltransferase involved in cell wall biosynthesis